MSDEDRRRWDERYADADWAAAEPRLPEAFAPAENLFPLEGRALEIASGRGEMSVWLALRGMDVLGLDVSPVAIGLARDLAAASEVADRCRFVVWDLDDGLPPGSPVDLVVCHMFRVPDLDQPLIDRLAAGGLLAVASLSEVGGEPGRFRAHPGELRDAFRTLDLLVEAEEDGVALFLGRKPG